MLCPITHCLMADPVVSNSRAARRPVHSPRAHPPRHAGQVTADGHSYERAAIERWLREHEGAKRTSPLTGAHLETDVLIPNIPLRKMIEDHKAAQAGASG